MQRMFAAVLAYVAFVPGLHAQGPVIQHAPVGCVVAEQFSRIDARVSPADRISRSRVYFRASGTTAWYFVAMTAEAGVQRAVLPRPEKKTKAIDYYVEVLDGSLAGGRTAEFTPRVVPWAGFCKSASGVAATATTARLAIGAEPGSPAIPIGFMRSSLVTAKPAAKAVDESSRPVTAKPAAKPGGGSSGPASAKPAAKPGGASSGPVRTKPAARSGGGSSAGLVLGIAGGAAAIAGGVVVAANAKDGGSSSSSSGSTPQPGPTTPAGPSTPTFVIQFGPPPGIDVSACAGRPLAFARQTVTPAADGSFDVVWAPEAPNVMRAAGRLDSTLLKADLSCVQGGPHGSIVATSSGGNNYSGTFEFLASQGTIVVTRQ